MSRKTYTETEKGAILKELEITPLNGMVNSRQAARILSERAKQETGEEHTYSDNAIRWRVKTKKLDVAAMMNNRLSLFNVNDIFLLDLEPHKWWSKGRRNPARPDVTDRNRSRRDVIEDANVARPEKKKI